ncbi:receptor-type tyrosine-protein phosphatase f [Plakobranchus ocellatus]|uniref:Receptor-type tyrosine-protein phosphatase f n=1 Tax=Plakobranchus ocellatus TaxID=259542 RepID=A0AAV3XWB8_9GAST|nr:receptor-type tyrosine-protein phosphatase f [Plakobranchus ocellatus]
MRREGSSMNAIFCVICLLAMMENVHSKTDLDLCGEDWLYHKHTSTCIRLFRTWTYFSAAKSSCESYRGGPSGKEAGRLVCILDYETDKFVRSLLKTDEKAFFGLVYRDNQYTWVDKISPVNHYRNWLRGHPKTNYLDYPYEYVVVTQYGWESLYYNKKRFYVCQKHPAFSQPVMTCEPAEEGKTFPSLSCSYPVDNVVGDFVLSMIANHAAADEQALILKCNTDRQCRPTNNFLSGRITKEYNDRLLVTELTLNRVVSRSHDGSQWACEYKFINTENTALLDSCTIEVYRSPLTVNCSYSFPNTGGILVICESLGAYPKPSSEWVHYIDKEKSDTVTHIGHHKEQQEGGELVFDSTFQYLIIDVPIGDHHIEISIVPSLVFPNNEAKQRASQKVSVDFRINLPQQAPAFFTQDRPDIILNQLTVSEDQIITFSCKVEGGSPPVRSVDIWCDYAVQDSSETNKWGSAGQQVQVVLPITRTMDQKMCTCSGNHVSGMHTKQTSVTLNVLYAAEIMSFTVNGMEKLEVSEKRNAKFRCSAHGNPKPQLQLYQLYNDGRRKKMLKQTVGNYADYYIFRASCDTSGSYVCSAKNNLSTETSERRVDIRVKCRLRTCSEIYSDREFSVLPGAKAVVTLCVFAYPQPNSDIRLRPDKGNNFAKNLFTAKFTYSGSVETKGNVIVHISASIAKHGNYTLLLYQDSSWYYIPFSLIPYKKPSCPESLNIEQVGSTFVVLSWTPAPSRRGISQTFIVSQIDAGGAAVDSTDIEDIGDLQMLYNITGLDPASDYRFKLSVKNAGGVSECPQQVVNLTTAALPVYAERSGSENAGVVAGAVITVLIVIAIVAALVLILVRRTRLHKRPQMPIWLRTGKKSSTHYQLNDTEAKRSSSRREQSTPMQDIYSQVNKSKKRKVPMEQESTYSNAAAIELHNQRYSSGPEARGASARSRNLPTYYDWSDGESLDDIDNGPEPCTGQKQGEKIDYANTPVVVEQNQEQDNPVLPPKTISPQEEETNVYSNSPAAQRKLEEEGKVQSAKEAPTEKEAKGKKKSGDLVYIEVDFSSEEGASSNKPRAHVARKPADELVAYAMLKHDAYPKGDSEL